MSLDNLSRLFLPNQFFFNVGQDNVIPFHL